MKPTNGIIFHIQGYITHSNIKSFYLGVYASLTADGNIIVQGVLTSCYASFDHDLAHFTMTPMQWYPEIIRWIFGVNKIYPGYVSIAKEVGRWVLA